MAGPDQEKDYLLKFENRAGYLYAYVEGDRDSYEISRSYWMEVAVEVKRLGARCVLIDENLLATGTMADMFKIASEIPGMGFGTTRVAFVDRYLEQNELNQFGELVAINRGLNGKIFNDTEEAVAWLLKDLVSVPNI